MVIVQGLLGLYLITQGYNGGGATSSTLSIIVGGSGIGSVLEEEDEGSVID